MNHEARYQIFVSSTYTDLQEERRAAVATLLEFGAIPAGMELFPAADEEAWTLIQRVIDECDYYLLLIGGRYGSVDGDGLSFTEKEFDYAVTVGKPIMAFLHGNPDEIPAGKSEKLESLQKNLHEFREKVQNTKHVKYWTSAEDLAGKIALTLPKFLTLYPAVGWVRGDSVPSGDTLAELNNLRKEKFELQERLQEAENRPPPGTEEFAQGEDQVELDVRYDVVAKKEGIYGPIGEWAFRETVTLPWDDILRTVGPTLMQEGEQAAIRKVLQSALWERDRKRLRSETRASLQEDLDDPTETTLSFRSFQLTDSSFDTVLLQMVALGLIQESQKPRSVKDRGTYWTLTPYGRSQLIRLRALKRP